MPPMPPAAGSSLVGSGASTTIASVVIMSEATPQASTNAVLTTFVGSITPYLFKSAYSPVAALNPSW